MILPEHIKIGFEIYNVAIGTGIEGEGECLPEKGSILVKPGMSDRRYASTIIHEVLHACWDQAELPEGEADLAGLKEEDVIARLSNLLTAALLDSPQLRQMLERVAGAANGTCWGWRERGLKVRVTPEMAAAIDRENARLGLELHTPCWPEQPQNAPVDKSDNEPRSVEKACICGKKTAFSCALGGCDP
mgnify:CR=1 FL=1